MLRTQSSAVLLQDWLAVQDHTSEVSHFEFVLSLPCIHPCSKVRLHTSQYATVWLGMAACLPI